MSDRNIRQVEFADYKFDTWYKSEGYFDFDSRRAKKTLIDRRSNSNTPDPEPQLPSDLVTSSGQSKQSGTSIRDSGNSTGKNGGKIVDSIIKDSNTNSSLVDVLYVCRTCFKYTINRINMYQHEQLCKYKRNPPGSLVYRDNTYSIRKVDGVLYPLFGQCLCLFSQLFLDSKSVYFNLSGFEFFVLYRRDSGTPLGYYSREKNSWDGFNLACILVFPPFQSLGLGKLLIAYSYHVSRLEGGVGSPEKPLSTYGHAGYMSYWCQAVARAILVEINDDQKQISMEQVSKVTGIIPEDVEQALNHMNALHDDSISLIAIQDYISHHRISLTPIINPDHCLS